MPSPKTSKLGAVLAFFRKADMQLVEEGLALIREVVAERKGATEKIRQGQLKAAAARARGKAPKPAATPAASATPAATAVAGTGGKKAAVAKAKKKQAAAGTASTPAPTKKRKRNRGKAAAATHTAPPVDPALTDEELDAVDTEPANGTEPYAEGASQV